MLIVNCSDYGEKILYELKSISLNENGKPIDLNLLNIIELKDFSYKNLLSNEKIIFLSEESLYEIGNIFHENCKKEDKEPCLILFDSRTMSINKDGWVRRLIDNGFSSRNILIVAARNISKEEFIFIKEKGIRIISMNQLLEDLHDTCDTIMEFSYGKELFLSVNFNVVDPVFVSLSEDVGGLTSREFIYLIQRMSMIKHLKIVDLIISSYERRDVQLGAKILSEII